MASALHSSPYHEAFLAQEWLARMVASYSVDAPWTLPPILEEGLFRLVASNWHCCYYCFPPLQLRAASVSLAHDAEFRKALDAFDVSLLSGVRGRPLDHSRCKSKWNAARRQSWVRALLVNAVQVQPES